VDKILANHASFLPKPQIPLEPAKNDTMKKKSACFEFQCTLMPGNYKPGLRIHTQAQLSHSKVPAT
jgi:hypothetical protein